MVKKKQATTLNGKVIQSDKQYFTLRMKITAGQLSLAELDAIKRLAEKFGRGEVHLTTRQGLEIPWLKADDSEAISRFVKKEGLITGSTGKKLRNVNACPGNTHCRFGQIDSPALAKEIDKRMATWQLPSKLKVAVSGCPHSCAKPQVNDIGLTGAVRPRLVRKNCTACGACVKVCRVSAWRLEGSNLRFLRRECVDCGNCIRSCRYSALVVKRAGVNLYVGGKVGRRPLIGKRLVELWPAEEALKLIEEILRFYIAKGEKGERLGDFIKRYGYQKFKKEVLQFSSIQWLLLFI